MECAARIVRERTKYGQFAGDKKQTVVQIHCPVMGDIVLSGEQAERAIQRIRENEGKSLSL